MNQLTDQPIQPQDNSVSPERPNAQPPSDTRVAEASAKYLAKTAGTATPVSSACLPGYKLTEVGVIPEDWDVLKGHQLFIKIQDGTHFSPKVSGGEFLYVTSKNIKFGYLDINSAGFIDRTQHESIYKRCDVRKMDILLTKDGANTGNAALNTLSEPFSLLSSVAFMRLDLDIHSPEFFLQQILSNNFQKYIQDEMSGNAITRLTLKKINHLNFFVPSRKEQTAIANALSDMDALIGGLENLIAKKQAIKTATMQQLLTGRTRLPQFALREDGTHKGYKQSELGEIPEDWEVVYLSECGEFQSGNGFPTKYQGLKEGKYPFFKVSDMNNSGNEKFLINSNNYISDYVRSLISARVIAVNSIIFAKIGAAIFLERKKICSQPSCIDNNMMAFSADENKLHHEYAYLLFMSINLGDLVEATALPSLSGRDIGRRKIALPTRNEQTAIATILSDMDEEIQALQQRLEKTRQIKQGMMQELLTGRTRLVKPEQAA
ncbi:restriction endonuclease subunit S [Microbulbifer thermotolerans]|uniref:Restriction endonuclease subunit S n=1 Tax=Microbulbifer thermotolerans TaxID=252514 RepID=A0AB35HX16_MICTH|nr:restriction endonuclease subunit S [Microbulbifer thermotolerans]MCX2801107.1 restriction endonuclease subunit S [Microbulbifer thermotolerans]